MAGPLSSSALRSLAAAGALLTTTVSAQQLAPLDPNLLISRAPFVLSHDAATGYLEVASPLFDPYGAYAKTQVGTFTEQLGCGARAFDLRPSLVNDDVFFRHGDVEITEITFRDGVQEILDWAASGTSPDDLVLLKIVKCGGRCNKAVRTILEELGVELISDCLELASLTVGQVLELGSVVALAGSCFVQNFDRSLTCHGFLPDNDSSNVEAVRDCVPDTIDLEGGLTAIFTAYECLKRTLTRELVNTFGCWANSQNDFAINQLLNYLDEVVAAGPPEDGSLWQLQALWQVGPDSVLFGLFRPLPLPDSITAVDASSIIRDVEESEVNCLVAEYIAERSDAVFNQVEIDNVCGECGSQVAGILRPAPTGAPVNMSEPTSVADPPIGGDGSPRPAPDVATPTVSPVGNFTAIPTAEFSIDDPTESPAAGPMCSIRTGVSRCDALVATTSEVCDCYNFCNGDFISCCEFGGPCTLICGGTVVAGCTKENEDDIGDGLPPTTSPASSGSGPSIASHSAGSAVNGKAFSQVVEAIVVAGLGWLLL